MTYTNINNTTKARRAQIKALQDEFSTFSWGGLDAFETYGAFIINDKKGSLKFHNGPSFSNEYSKPQFSQNTGDLLGVNFNRSTISFTVGVYWFSIEEYRKMMHWLHPLKTDMLCFGFNTKFGYMAKLSKIGDSPKHVVGKENGEPRYYTELNLTFEVQGDQVARGQHPYELTGGEEKTSQTDSFTRYYYQIKNDETCKNEFVASDLPTPIVFNLGFGINSQHTTAAVELVAKYKDEEITLFNTNLQNLLYDSRATNFNITYNSGTGILYLQYGNSSEKLLSLLTTSDTGERMVTSVFSEKFFLPGQLDFNNFKVEDVKFIVGVQNIGFKKLTIECFPRTNIL